MVFNGHTGAVRGYDQVMVFLVHLSLLWPDVWVIANAIDCIGVGTFEQEEMMTTN